MEHYGCFLSSESNDLFFPQVSPLTLSRYITYHIFSVLKNTNSIFKKFLSRMIVQLRCCRLVADLMNSQSSNSQSTTKNDVIPSMPRCQGHRSDHVRESRYRATHAKVFTLFIYVSCTCKKDMYMGNYTCRHRDNVSHE